MVKKIQSFFILLLTCCNLIAGGDDKKDTVQALVISTPLNSEEAFPLSHLKEMTGSEIIQMIDSLLDLDAVPVELIEGINNYAESKIKKHDYYISLTGFYDSSVYPSNNIYQNWDTYRLYPYSEQLRKDDQAVKLVLKDDRNYCHFIPPLKGLITSNFGWRDGRSHNGIDIDLQVWDTVVSAFDGMVRVARYHPGYGRVVIIRHYNGLETLYAHFHRLKVKAGDIVEAGQLVGLGGSSGRSTGSHLHFEVRFKGKALNPRSVIDFNHNCLISDSLLLKKNRWSYSPIPLGIEYHTVKKGEYLLKIAQKYGLSIPRICEMNGIRRNQILRVGQKLRVGS